MRPEELNSSPEEIVLLFHIVVIFQINRTTNRYWVQTPVLPKKKKKKKSKKYQRNKTT
jgi:hypothetical protein